MLFRSKAERNLNTLVDYRYTQHFKAEKGENGKGKNKTGKTGKDLILKVPIGTQILEEDNKQAKQDKGMRDTRYPEKMFLCAKKEVELLARSTIGFSKIGNKNCWRIPTRANNPPKHNKIFK